MALFAEMLAFKAPTLNIQAAETFKPRSKHSGRQDNQGPTLNIQAAETLP